MKTWPIRALALAAALVVAALLGAAIAANGRTNQVERTQAVQPPAAALSLQNAFVKVVNAVSPAVVQIETPSGLGSGVVFDTKGDIVTNYHVVGKRAAVRRHHRQRGGGRPRPSWAPSRRTTSR